MNELDARFALLTNEMSEIQHGIRSYDTMRSQIQGWAVTVALAAAGLALTTGVPSAALLGVFSSAAFWGIDGHRRSIQRQLIQRYVDIECALDGCSLSDALGAESALRVPGLAHHMSVGPNTDPRGRYARILKEVARPGTWVLYAATSAALLLTWVATWLF